MFLSCVCFCVFLVAGFLEFYVFWIFVFLVVCILGLLGFCTGYLVMGSWYCVLGKTQKTKIQTLAQANIQKTNSGILRKQSNKLRPGAKKQALFF